MDGSRGSRSLPGRRRSRISPTTAGPSRCSWSSDEAALLRWRIRTGRGRRGRAARRVDEGTALEHVAGYTCVNDVSARDLQFRSSQWLLGKAIDGFLPMGPWLVTSDEIADPQSLGIRCTVNGETLQDSSTGQ